MLRTTTTILACLPVLLAGAAASAQSRQVPGPPQSAAVAVHSATIHPVTAPVIDSGYVLFENGVISDVGAGAPPDRPGLERIDASGLHVYPGLVAADTNLGLTETGAVEVTQDHTEFGRVTPEVRAAVALNPDSDLIPVTRANGVLTALVLPRGGLVSGRAAVVRMDGWTWEDLAIEPDAGLVVNWPRTEPITAPWMERSVSQQRKELKEQLDEIDRLFDRAEAYLAARAHDPEQRTDLRYEGMRAVIDGERPVFVRAASAGQIESAIAWARRRGLRIVIVGGTDVERAIPLLVRHDVPVIVRGVHRLPRARHAAYDQPFTVPLRLNEAGVPFAIASGSNAAHERNLNHNAATAAAYGLPADAALRAVTIDAATILGVGERLGSLEDGKSATLIVTTGDPLEITTDTLVAFIDGRRIDLGNRQKALYAKYVEKYRQLGLLE